MVGVEVCGWCTMVSLHSFLTVIVQFGLETTERLSLKETNLGELFQRIPPNILEMTNLGKLRYSFYRWFYPNLTDTNTCRRFLEVLNLANNEIDGTISTSIGRLSSLSKSSKFWATAQKVICWILTLFCSLTYSRSRFVGKQFCGTSFYSVSEYVRLRWHFGRK